jgi:NADPH-dependent curcumin reductase CurA
MNPVNPAVERLVNRRIVLKSNLESEPNLSDFEVVTKEVPAIAEGQMLLRNRSYTRIPCFE